MVLESRALHRAGGIYFPWPQKSTKLPLLSFSGWDHPKPPGSCGLAHSVG